MTRRRSNQSSAGQNSFGARGALLASGLVAASIWACSSSVDLEPVTETTGEGDLNPPAGSAGSGSTQVAPSNPINEVIPTPMLVNSGSSGAGGGTSGLSGTGTGGATATGSSGGSADVMMPPVGAAGAPPCADNDGDGRCNDVDRCPDVSDQGADGDGDGAPDACDVCPLVQDNGRDSDGDGIGDACDPCGIHVALELNPLYYLPLDEGPAATTAVNRGSVPQTAAYIGPMERGVAGVSDPNGTAIRLSGGAGGEFSRVTITGINVFPTTALTATFWIRTTRAVEDSTFISFAIPQSQNEFGIFVDAERLRISLKSSSFIVNDLEPAEFADGAWHFMALTWEETLAQLYIDGEAAGAPIQTEPGFEVLERAGQELAPGPIILGNSLQGTPVFGGVLVFGQDQDGLNSGFNVDQAHVGGLDEVAIYDRALTVEEINRIYNGTTCGEICDGIDNDNDGTTDEGFLGSAAACAAPSCAAISDSSSAFGTGEYVSSINPDQPLVCNF
jgi:hypothetical protein